MRSQGDLHCFFLEGHGAQLGNFLPFQTASRKHKIYRPPDMSILPHITYKSYLLRLSRDAADARWQATLINVIGSHEVHHFVDLERLVTYLLDELDAPSAESGANPCDTFPNNL